MHLHAVGEAPRSDYTTGLPFLVWCMSGFRFPSLFLVEIGAEIQVASTIVPWHIVKPRAAKSVLTVSKICSPSPFYSSRLRKGRIVVSSGIRSLISSMPVKRHMLGISIRASSMAGSLKEYHCCKR
jgi:hypothetical protein